MNNYNAPLVSILIPTFNRAHYLDECLYSLTKQDYSAFEVVIRDNHSEDDTESIVKKYESFFQNRTGYRYIKNKINEGYINNIMRGVWSCSGKYCMILMDDDFLGTRNTISLFVSALEKSNCFSFAYSDTYEYIQGNASRTPKMIIDTMENINSKYSIIDGKEYFLNFWTKYGPITMSSFMFDRKLAMKGFWKKWTNLTCEDQNLVLSLTNNHDGIIFNEKLSYYRTHNEPNIGEIALRYNNATSQNHLDSHKCIKKWIDYGKISLRINTTSLFVYRLKSVILKDEGPIRWLYYKSGNNLKDYFKLLKNYSALHYYVQRYLSQQMIKYDYAVAIKCPNLFIRISKKKMIQLRNIISNYILQIDKVIHDSEMKINYKVKFLRFAFQSKINV